MKRGRKNVVTDISLRDSQGDQEVAAILAALGESHPARQAFIEGRPTMKIVQLANDHPEIARKLMLSYWDCHRRALLASAQADAPKPAEPKKKA
jgi:hypothetical protein